MFEAIRGVLGGNLEGFEHHLERKIEGRTPQRKIEKEEREEREFWESLYGIVGKEANVNKVYTKTSQNDEGTKYTRK